MIIVTIIFIKNSSGEKKNYLHLTGKLTYRDSIMDDLPFRDIGKYRYVKIENYPYPFEIYADEQAVGIDSLKTDDIVTVWFYETGNTRADRINRFMQFLQKDNKVYFKRTAFAANLGYSIIALLVMAIMFFFLLYKKNKIPY